MRITVSFRLFGRVGGSDRAARMRKRRSNAALRAIGVDIANELPPLPADLGDRMKSAEEIAKRAVACACAADLAETVSGADEDGGVYESAREDAARTVCGYGVGDRLLEKELSLFDGTYTDGDADDVLWTRESCWALCWALGLISELSMREPYEQCGDAADLILGCGTIDELLEICVPRSVDEILDMLDFYYRLHWACVDKTMHPKTRTGKVDPDVVCERRRGLQWIFDAGEDWFLTPLDT